MVARSWHYHNKTQFRWSPEEKLFLNSDTYNLLRPGFHGAFCRSSTALQLSPGKDQMTGSILSEEQTNKLNLHKSRAHISCHFTGGLEFCTLNSNTVGTCEGKFEGHRTPDTATAGDCGRKHPSAQSCQWWCPCHPKIAKDISSPAALCREDGHETEQGQKFLHVWDVHKTNWCWYVPRTWSISTGQLCPGLHKRMANSWCASWGDTRRQWLPIYPWF